ncbi:McrC family protein [Lyngbya sp. PCC 8106]|uniref:McrC family protein n=1 Tax=Lyngbya sp. (strain PCC 8106) TaxID=313612 RepID=UPI0000EAA94F|nr:restriction endonuclease [Lyngbya sp. PCC 8106]EAW37476.1 putative restriction enzyme modulator protein [Lyngbya sp. PCC 8106]
MNQPKIIELTEHQPKLFERDELDQEIAELIWKNHKHLIDVEFPSIKTNNKYKLKPRGWVGQIILTPELHIYIKPKVPISNLFGMLEYAYQLKSFKIFDHQFTQCQSVDDFYSRLAAFLADKILARTRRGLYRTYIPVSSHLSAIRGKIDLRETVKKPWNVKLKCHYDEQTADIEDNQILLWTLYIIGRTGLCSPTVSPKIRKAYHVLNGLVTHRSFQGKDCVNRSYNRLNQDYQIMHSICLFFLDNCGASHQVGNYTMFSFLVNMANLYELFVAEWLKLNLPSHLSVRIQSPVYIGKIRRRIDIEIYNTTTQNTLYILDTKYKLPDDKPSNSDIDQVNTYASHKNCSNAVLVYPVPFKNPFNEEIGVKIRVRSLTFSINEDLEQAGQNFLKNLCQEE